MLGRIHDDEVFQFLEPALFRARGYGILSWEWRQGLRNWAFPGAISLVIRLSDALGVEDPRVCRALIAVPQWLLHAGALAAVDRYAARRLSSRARGVAVLLVGLYGPLLVFSGRTLSEAYSADFLLMGAVALDGTERPFRAGLWGGISMGMAVVARYGSLLFALAAGVWLLARRAYRSLGGLCLGGLLVALLLTALDQVTYGAPLHSLRAYVDFNVLSGKAADTFGREPGWFFLPLLLELTPLWAWAGFVFSWRRGAPRVSLGLFMALVYGVAISLTAHKETRFLYPAMVLLTLEGAIGVLSWAGRQGTAAWLSVPAVALAVLASFAPAFVFPVERGGQFRAVVKATRALDVTGLLLMNEGVWGSPGFFFMGKNIAFNVCDWPSPACVQTLQNPLFNRVSTYENRGEDGRDLSGVPELTAAGFRVLGRDGKATWLERPK